MTNLTEEEKKEIDTIKEDTSLATNNSSLGIKGLEDVPASVMPLPFVRLVQSVSRDIELATGKDAEAGSYFFNGIKESVNELRFALLRATHGEMSYKRGDEVITGWRVALLGVRLENLEPFLMSVSATSINNFGALVSQLKAKKVKKSYEYEITATSEKQENKKGKYFVAKFNLGEKIDDKTLIELDKLYDQYKSTLDRKETEEELF